MAEGQSTESIWSVKHDERWNQYVDNVLGQTERQNHDKVRKKLSQLKTEVVLKQQFDPKLSLKNVIVRMTMDTRNTLKLKRVQLKDPGKWTVARKLKNEIGQLEDRHVMLNRLSVSAGCLHIHESDDDNNVKDKTGKLSSTQDKQSVTVDPGKSLYPRLDQPFPPPYTDFNPPAVSLPHQMPVSIVFY